MKTCGAEGRHNSVQGRGQLGMARAERTLNIHFIVVTLDVSRLSGWLNADALCRVERRAYELGGVLGVEEALGAGKCAWRTRNMAHIVVTSDVSKSSGWL